MELMHILKSLDLLSWIWNFLVAVFFSVISGFLLVVASLFASFIFFCLNIIINYLLISWRGGAVCFRTVSYAAARKIMFLSCCWIVPFNRVITIEFLVLVTWNLIDASVSSEIWLMNFEDVWMKATHACVFVIMMGGLSGGRWVL